MKVLFIRHGESQDDLEDRYGGWADFPLTKKGTSQIKDKVDYIKDLKEDFEIIFSSPLKRALESAKILSEVLDIPLQTMEYVKERNTYGLLSGMEKSEAKHKYPEQVQKLDNDQYVDGSERYEDLTNRIEKSLDMLKKSNYNKIIVVTHGNYLKCMFKEFVGKKLTEKEDGGCVLFEFKNSKMIPLCANGIEYANGESSH